MKSEQKIQDTIIYVLRHRENESERIKGARYALQWAIDYFVTPKDNDDSFKKIFESEACVGN